MKRTEKQAIADALRAELNRAQDTKIETQGIFLLMAGYVRSLPVLGYTPSDEEVDLVAFTLEAFGKRMEGECDRIISAATPACRALKTKRKGGRP